MHRSILFFSILIVACNIVFAQTDSVKIDHAPVIIDHNDPIYIYDSAFSTKPKRVIQMLPEIENVYAFQVINDSLYRFEVEIWEPFAEISPVKSRGWIDKINIGVFLGVRDYSDGVYLKLFESPDKKSKSIRIAENDHCTMWGYVDKIEGKWYHVNVIYDGVLYSGWTDIYNVNPYCC